VQDPVRFLDVAEQPQEEADIDIDVAGDGGVVAEIVGDAFPDAVEVQADEFAAGVDHGAAGVASGGIGVGEEIERDVFGLDLLGGVEDKWRDGEGLRAGVLLDHPGEGGLRGVLHAIARDVAFDVGETDAEGAVGVGRGARRDLFLYKTHRLVQLAVCMPYGEKRDRRKKVLARFAAQIQRAAKGVDHHGGA